MRLAEAKRRRKRIRNLETALRDHIPITAPKTQVLWTPSQRA